MDNPLARIRSFWLTRSALTRALLSFGAAFAFGLLVLPWLIFLAGQLILGAYKGGNAFNFMGDFLSALGHGNLAFWLIALGPAIFLAVARLMWLGLHRPSTG